MCLHISHEVVADLSGDCAGSMSCNVGSGCPAQRCMGGLKRATLRAANQCRHLIDWLWFGLAGFANAPKEYACLAV
jgi:hypothetical protein